MENMDLIDLRSPNNFENTSNIATSNSPGNNPFDVVSNLASNFSQASFEETSFRFFDKSFDVDNFNFGRESMDSFPRESLGILKMEFLEDFNDSTKLIGTLTPSVLDTGFLCTGSSDKPIYLSSSSSISSNPLEFNSGSLEFSEPSKIYSISSLQLSRNCDLMSKTERILNEAFVKSVNVSLDQNEWAAKLRLSSLPELHVVEDRVDSLLSKSVNCLEVQVPGSDCKDNVDDAFNDSVFIEAKHFTTKFADRSILSTKCFEDDLLDSTSPPELDDEITQPEQEEITNANVFKHIDKLIPPLEDQHTDEPIENEQSSESFTQRPDQQQTKDQSLEIKQNFSAFNRTVSSGSDANDLLCNLSLIINNEGRDLKQIREGQKLLSSLADILCFQQPPAVDSLDDSGNSSVDHESDYNPYVALQSQSKTNSKSADNEHALDLSLKKSLSNSFTFSSQRTAVSALSNGTKLASSSKLERNKIVCGSKLKPKRNEESAVLKRGPLKATIPIGNMLKYQSVGSKMSTATVTPPKMENHQSALFKSKRTSTPIMEPQPKPVAQSTPENPNLELKKSRSLRKPKAYSPVYSQVPKSTLNKSGSCKDPSPILNRRHSESELNDSKPSPPLKRSYSIGKSSKISVGASQKVTVKKVLQNAVGAVNQQPNILREKNRLSNLKPCSLLNKIRKSKADKENANVI